MIDYYLVLKVSVSSSKNDIKKAYRREASKWHPDKNSSPDATEKMQLINEAYLILNDDEARSRYDIELARFHKSKQSLNSRHEPKSDSKASDKCQNEEFRFNDDVLKDWMEKAKKQSTELAKQSLNDLVGMSKMASKSAWDAVEGYVYFLAILTFIFLILPI